VRNGVANANYSECSLATTGETCTPVCPTDYKATGNSSGFVLVCGDDGGYDAAADLGHLACAVRNSNSSARIGSAVAGAIFGVLLFTLGVVLLLKMKARKPNVKIVPSLCVESQSESMMEPMASYESVSEDETAEGGFNEVAPVPHGLHLGLPPIPRGSAMHHQLGHLKIARESSFINANAQRNSRLSMKAARRSSMQNASMHNQLGGKVDNLQTRSDELVGSTDPNDILQMERTIAKLEEEILSGIGDIISADAVAEYKRRLRLARDRLHISNSLDAQLKDRLLRRMFAAKCKIEARQSMVSSNGLTSTSSLNDSDEVVDQASIVFAWGTYLTS
jgi:hypothetical protein